MESGFENRELTREWPRVSVIVPYYMSGLGSLLGCLDALAEQDYPSDLLQVIVVDNNEQPVVATLSELKGADVTVLHQPKPGSYAARNTGIAAAVGDVIAFTDADCRPARSWLREGVTALLDNEGCGLVGGAVNHLFRDRENPNPCELFDKCVYMRQKDYVETQHFAATANVFTFAWVLKSVGGFDEAFFSGADRDWGIRIWKSGLGVCFAPDAVVDHPARSAMNEHFAKARRLAGQGYVHARKKRLVLARMLLGECRLARERYALIHRQRTSLGSKYAGVLNVYSRVFAVRLLEAVRLCFKAPMTR